jgi:transcriptional regulator with PAS, ATPase and Fis domain
MTVAGKISSGLIALKKIVEGTSESTGQQFFESLVKNLAEILGVYGVWVTEYLAEKERLRALAFFLNGEFVEEYEYRVKGTPCEPVLSNEGICHIPDKVIELFPEDPDLEPLGAVSYMGLALKDTDGSVLGHLAMLDNKPMEEMPETFAIFRIFASRATAELRRLNSERNLRENREKLNRLMNGTSELVFEFNSQMLLTQANQAAVHALNINVETIQDLSITGIFDQDSRRKFLDAVEDLRLGSASIWVPGPLFCLTGDGTKISVEASLSAYTYRNEIFYALFIRNIQEKIISEEKIRKLDLETIRLREKVHEHEFENILGQSEAIKNTLRLVTRVAKTSSTVLIQGETGTGKELVAKAIHDCSLRKHESFITLNCAALPAELIESELFGHIKGAFTGATMARDGRFLLADKGTIFLDEIGEFPLTLQPKLLRVLQEGTFEPVGSSDTKKVDVRIIAATNRDLAREVLHGRFREDLFYRLNVFPIAVPPLREREDDVILLAEAFFEKYNRRYGFDRIPLDQSNYAVLKRYSWPGNVRELQNVIERAVIVGWTGKVDLLALLPDISGQNKNHIRPEEDRIFTEEEMMEMERKNILLALEKTRWKVSGRNGAATILGIPSTTLNSRMIRLGITKK